MQGNGQTMMTKPHISSDNKCEHCGGSGWYIYDQPVKEYMSENGLENIYGDRNFAITVSKRCPWCNGGLMTQAKAVKKTADIPSTFYDKRMADFDWGVYVDDSGNAVETTQQQKGVTAFIDQFEKWERENIGLYIYSGTKGSGKTFLASCICNELMNKMAIKTRFVSASQLIDISQSGDKAAFDEYKRTPMKLLYECKLLVIDDLGQRGGEWIEDILFTLLDMRMTNRRMTIITSNMSINQLPYNERITDRINKICMPFHLPEVEVRTKETSEARRKLLKELGWD